MEFLYQKPLESRCVRGIECGYKRENVDSEETAGNSGAGYIVVPWTLEIQWRRQPFAQLRASIRGHTLMVMTMLMVLSCIHDIQILMRNSNGDR